MDPAFHSERRSTMIDCASRALLHPRAFGWLVRALASAAVLAPAGVASGQSIEVYQCTSSPTSDTPSDMVVQQTCSVPASECYGFCCVKGFIVSNTDCTGVATNTMTVTSNSLSLTTTFNSDSCCTAPYANIGAFDGDGYERRSDQYLDPKKPLTSSHLPIQLKDLAEPFKGREAFLAVAGQARLGFSACNPGCENHQQDGDRAGPHPDPSVAAGSWTH